MTRWHGIKSNTYENIIIDSGAVYYNFTDIDNPGTLLGATRGGASFTRKPKYIDLPYEGIVGSVKGEKHLIGVDVELEVNVITLDGPNMSLFIPNSVNVSGEIKEIQWDNSSVYKIDNIAIIGEISGTSEPIVLKIDNPLCISDFDVSLKDKSENVSKFIFKAHYDESVGFDSAPWSISSPNLMFLVAVARNTDDFAYTDNGYSWYSGKMPLSGAWNGVAKSPSGRYVAAIDSVQQSIAYSDDGINWIEADIPVDRSCLRVACNSSGRFVITCWEAFGFYSDNGINWTQMSLPSYAQWNNIAVNSSGRFVIVAYSDNKGAYSDDGVTWTPYSMPALREWDGLTVNSSGRFVIVVKNSNISAYSDDGINWTETTLPESKAWTDVAVNSSGRFVAIAFNSSLIAYSDNGITWQSSIHENRFWEKIAVGSNDRFVAIASSGGYVSYSDDGINWKASTMPNKQWSDIV